MANFVAIDFETADHGRDSACAVGFVKVANGMIVERRYRLIRPPRQTFAFTYLHGISWQDVAGHPAFDEVWSELAPLVEPTDLILAHNASFDRGVLAAGCGAHGIQMPTNAFACTVKVARELWDIRPTKLNDVCRHLAIDLQHHHADSDAHACAQIGLAALREGFDLESIAEPTKRSKGGSRRQAASSALPKPKRALSRRPSRSPTPIHTATTKAPPMLQSVAGESSGPASAGSVSTGRNGHLLHGEALDRAGASKSSNRADWPGVFTIAVIGIGICSIAWVVIRAAF